MLKFLFIFTFPIVFCEEMKLGACPEVEVVGGFDYEKFSGIWYVVQETQAKSSCVKLDFKTDEKSGKIVEESLKPLGLSIPKYMEKFTQIGTLRVPSAKFPGKMKVTFPFSIIPNTEVDFHIMDTDYTTYAAVFSCRPLLVVGHRQLAMILSRESTLDQSIIKKLRDKFDFHNVNPHSFGIVSHKNCDAGNNKENNDEKDKKAKEEKEE